MANLEKSAPKTKKPSKKLWLVVAGVIILIGLTVYFGVAWYQGYKFKQAQSKMDKLTAAFIDKIGQPDSKKTNHQCGYSSVPYGRGRLSCGFGTTMYYKIDDINQAREYVKKLQDIANSRTNLVKVTFTQPVPKNWSDRTSGFDTPMNDVFIYKDAHCSIGYSLKELGQIDYLRIGAGCSTYPLRPIFDVDTNR